MDPARDSLTRAVAELASRGYQWAAIDRFLTRLSAALEQQAGAAGEGEGEPAPLAERGDTGEQIANLLAQAEESAREIRSTARNEADEILTGAQQERQETQRMRSEAEQLAEEIVVQAELRAVAILESARRAAREAQLLLEREQQTHGGRRPPEPEPSEPETEPDGVEPVEPPPPAYPDTAEMEPVDEPVELDEPETIEQPPPPAERLEYRPPLAERLLLAEPGQPGGPATVPAAIALAVFVVWSALDGGFPGTIWYSGAIVILLALAVTVVRTPPNLARLSRPLQLALGLFVLLTLWSYASILWAENPGIACEGANRTLLYLFVFSLFVLWPWGSMTAAKLLGGYALAVAALGLAALVNGVSLEDPAGLFTNARLASPVGYPNADAALWLTAFWPAAFLASRREVHWALRGLLLAAAGILLELAMLAQSRGAMVAFALVLIAYLALVPGRVRALTALLPLAAAGAATAGLLLKVYQAGQGPDRLASPLLDAATAILVSAIALLLIGAGIALIDRSVNPRPATVRRAGIALAAVGTVVVIAALTLGIGKAGGPSAWASDRWDEFSGGPIPETASSRFGAGLGSNRHDVWRVALDEFDSDPLIGVGADNFAADYLVGRKLDEQPLYPHSMLLRLPAQLGLIGGLMFAGFLIAALVALVALRRRPDRFQRALALAALMPFLYWLAHGAVDWLWEFPALGGPALASLGLACSLACNTEPGEDEPHWVVTKRRSVPLIAAVVIISVAALVGFGASWLSAIETDRAAAGWRTDRGAAFDELDRAADLDPLADQPYLVAGSIASRLGQPARAQRYFDLALERNPRGWYGELNLGLLAAARADRTAALLHLTRAQRLNPRDRATVRALRRVRAGRPVGAGALNERFLQGVRTQVETAAGRQSR